ncbi:MAG: hypothetical protein CVU56_01300 [Deltaproteobacteria bacterium HGW-Deltaproteobacteria-14]|nr:MAG: hypothetical protein CVU56_01300 [Deltaproteobacteria bacterium HGW-Deltaproteobacteria-14]
MISSHNLPTAAALAAALLWCGGALADPLPVVHPAGSLGTVFNAHVAQQITVEVPDTIAFDVVDVSADTQATAPATVAVSAMALAPGGSLAISIVADAAQFTGPDGAPSWDAGDVSWVAATGTNFTGAAGTLAAGTPRETGRCAVGANVCTTTDLVFSLKANAAVRAGDHTLSARWKFEVLF